MKKYIIYFLLVFSIQIYAKITVNLPKTPITIDFEEADIVEVFKLLAIKSKINIITTPDVTGTITLNVKNVPFDQVFNMILELKGLSYEPVAYNTIKIAPPKTLTEGRKTRLTATKTIRLNYANPDDIKSILTSIATREGREPPTINVDPNTNSVIITDTLEGLETATKLIKEVDVKPQQVVIEAKIIDLTVSDVSSLGIKWSYISSKPTLDAAKSETTMTGENVGVSVKSEVPIPTGGLTFNLGYVTDNITFNKQFAALVESGRTKLIANPRVATVNNKEAKILIGEKIPYKTTTVSPGVGAAESFSFLEAGIKLAVTPTIAPNKWLTLKVKPEVSVAGSAPAGMPPSVSTREVEANIMVKDGDTVVIGGLVKEDMIKEASKVPLLGDIPLIGYLFRYTKSTKRKTELLIFLTPKIIENP